MIEEGELQMNELIEIIEDIKIKLNSNSYKDEQHVRFSLVGRICQALGWDIWNPEEFYSEYPVKKYPPNEVTTELRGKVDVALLLPERRNDIAEVFIEIKTPKKLQTELKAGEAQLQKYTYWDKSTISILTDGLIWRFYLPSAGGSFEDKLFTEFNILTTDIDLICGILNQVLRKDNFHRKAMQAAEDMLDELVKIRLINAVKKESIEIAHKTGSSMFLIAEQILKNQYKKDIPANVIENLWNRPLPSNTHQIQEYPKPEIKIHHGKGDVQADHKPESPDRLSIKGRKPKGVFAIDQWYDATSWTRVKEITYSLILDKLIDAQLPKSFMVSKNPHFFSHKSIQVGKTGYYIDVTFYADTIVEHCRRAIKVAGYDPKVAWKFELQDKQ